MATSEKLAKESLLGVDSIATARIYPAWFSERTGYSQVVLET